YASATGAIMTVPFDQRRRVTTGTPVPLVQDVVMDAVGAAKADVSASGTLIYRSGKAETLPVLARGAAVTPLLSDAREFTTPRFSPDGGRVAFTVGSTDVWVYDRAKATPTSIRSE